MPAPTTNPATTTAPAPEFEAGWTGGLLDDIDIDGDSLRPLDSLTEGDVIVPAAPSGWRVSDAAWTDPDNAIPPELVEWSVEVIEAPPHNPFGQVLYLTQSREPICRTTLGCKPSGDSVTINGVVWEVIVVERIPEDAPGFVDATTLRARIGDRWVALAAGAKHLLTGPLLENPPIIEFLEGLRVGSPSDLAAIGEACWGCAGGDPFAATESPTATPTTMSDGATTATSDPGARAPSDVSSETGRPLTDLAPGDVVVPTYIPPGMTLQDTVQIYEDRSGLTEFSVSVETADGAHSISISLQNWGHDVGPLNPGALNDPNHPPVEIADLTWGWGDIEPARIANIGPFSVLVYLDGLDRSHAEQFIEGLRAIPIEQFPNPIVSDGLSVIDTNDPDRADIVARDDRFELTAVRVGDQVCTKLEETTVPATMTFAGNCWESTSLAEPGIVDLFSLEITATLHLIIGVFDSPDATAVRITSPDGNSVVAPTGPVNQAIDGRFFLARLDVDVTNGIQEDRFTIEDASP